MEVKINFLDGSNFDFKSNVDDELKSVDLAIRSARKSGIESPVLCYDLSPSDLESIINPHA